MRLAENTRIQMISQTKQYRAEGVDWLKSLSSEEMMELAGFLNSLQSDHPAMTTIFNLAKFALSKLILSVDAEERGE